MSSVPNRRIPRTVEAPNGATVRTKRGTRYVVALSVWTVNGEPACDILAGSDCLTTARKRAVRYWRTLTGVNRAPYGEGTTWQAFDLDEFEPVAIDAVCECAKCSER